MKKYRIIAGADFGSLEDQINDLLSHEGGELVGGVVHANYQDGSTGVLQAMMVNDESVPAHEPEWIPDGKNGFYHGVYEDEGNWHVLHMSECEGGENCRLFKHLNRQDSGVKLDHGYEYTVTEKDGEFIFDGRELKEESE